MILSDSELMWCETPQIEFTVQCSAVYSQELQCIILISSAALRLDAACADARSSSDEAQQKRSPEALKTNYQCDLNELPVHVSWVLKLVKPPCSIVSPNRVPCSKSGITLSSSLFGRFYFMHSLRSEILHLSINKKSSKNFENEKSWSNLKSASENF